MEWKVLGLLRVVHAGGPEVSRSAAGRVGAEAVWVPTARLPRCGVVWTASDDFHLEASYQLDTTELHVHIELDDDARVRSIALDRWGEPDAAGKWDQHPFGFEATAYATFGGVTIPSAGRAGWFFGTERWPEGEFMRYGISNYQLLTA